MTPYYQDDFTTLYCADNREILPTLGRFDLLLTDPPYGLADTLSGGTWGDVEGGGFSWDQAAPNPDAAIARAGTAIIWGGNYFTVPPSRCWLSWFKPNAVATQSDMEMAWTNMDRPSKMFSWPTGGSGPKRQHPTEKPLPLMTWCLGFVPGAKTCLDPWAGSGTTGVACKLRGVHCTMIEREERYCKIIVERLRQGVLLPLPPAPAPAPDQQPTLF